MNDAARSTHWPKVIIGLILFFLLLTGWSVYRAAKGVSEVTNPRYYSHGLKYNDTLIEQEAAAGLGWQVGIRLADGRVEVRLTDRDGRPVVQAQAEVALYRTQAKEHRLLHLAEESAGLYAAALPEGLSGSLSARLQITRLGAGLSRSLLLNL
jgi:nitrogen fixation protein FixH